MPVNDSAQINDSGFRMIFSRSHDPLFIIDAETGYHQSANAAALAFIGYTLEALRQKTVFELLDLDSRDAIETALANLSPQTAEVLHATMCTQSGHAVPVEWSPVPFRSAGHSMALIHVRDITKRVQAQENLRWMVKKVETLKKIGAVVAARGGLQKNLDDVLEITYDVLGLEVGAVFLKGLPNGDDLYLAAHRGLPDSLAESIAELPADISEQVLTAGCPVIQEPVDPHAGPFMAILHDHGFSYMAATPILAHDGPVGLLAFATTGSTRLDEWQVYLFDRIGNEIGEAIVHQQLHEQTRRRLELMRAFQSISRQISLGRDPEETFVLIGQEAMRAMGADRMGIYLIDPATDRISCAWSTGLSPTYIDTIDALYEQIPGSQVVSYREPRLIADALTDPTMTPLYDVLKQEGYRSVGLFPLVSQDQTIGAIGYYYDDLHTFHPEEVEISQTFADEMATFVQNHRLLLRLQEADSWRRLTLESTGEAVCTADERSVIVDLNRAACEMFGYERHELLGKAVTELMQEEDRESHLTAFHRFVHEGRERRDLPIKGMGVRKDGSTFPLENSVGSFTTGDRRFVTAYIRDRSEVVQLEARLRQAQKMEAVGTLAGGVAHDFNNILTGVIGYIELAMMKLPDDHPVRGNLQKVKALGERAATLTRQLLAFSRQQVLEVRLVDLGAVVSELASMLNRVISEDIALNFILSADLWAVQADRAALEQILMNLCVNARDAMPEGGELLIETANTVIDETYIRAHPWAKPGRYALLSVSDTGVGMDEETMEHIFEPFFTTKEVGKGSGLGLAMVYGLVKQHNGFIHVYSEIGEGTTFKIYLPAVSGSPEQGATSMTESAISLSGQETVLVVEDEITLQELMSITLSEQGYHVLVASNGTEALGIWKAHRQEIDMIVADVVMPKMGGYDLYNYIQDQSPKTRFLFISGYSINGIHQRFLLDRGLEFLQKPFTPAQLLRHVRMVLAE